MEIKELIKEAHENANKHGFWEDWDIISVIAESTLNKLAKVEITHTTENVLIGNRLMLITGEVAEAQESLRKNDRSNFEEELADIAIRLFDLCGGLGIDLEAEIHKKMEKNKERPWKHGKAF